MTLYTLYNIIPIDDNCKFICKSVSGNYFPVEKSVRFGNINGTPLYFNNEFSAKTYIDKYMDKDKYIVQKFSCCENVFREITKMIIV